MSNTGVGPSSATDNPAAQSNSILRVDQKSNQRAFLVLSVPEGADSSRALAAGYGQVADWLRSSGMQIVQERIFASVAFEGVIKAARQDALQSRGVPAETPLNYIQGEPTWGKGAAGVIVHAVSEKDGEVCTITDDGVPCGRMWHGDGSLRLILQNMRGGDGTGEPGVQAGCAIERADRLLRASGADYRAVARTWFYLHNILDWYPEFNAARSARYTEFGLMPRPGEMPRQLPASTGIRAILPGGTACSFDLIAVADMPGRGPAVRFLVNPGQLEAVRYGSAFSRCAVIQGEKDDLLEISGTAAIDEAGKSIHIGDIRSQVRCTMEKVQLLIRQARAGLGDICAATIFIKHKEDAAAVREVLADMSLERLPAVYVVADVCREDLLFEIDAEAVVPCA